MDNFYTSVFVLIKASSLKKMHSPVAIITENTVDCIHSFHKQH